MPQEGAEDRYIRNRVNLPTEKSSAEISRDISPRIRARSFYSARVMEGHILDRFREISDNYNTGKIGRDEARSLMRDYARKSGMDDGTRAMKNLASTSRLEMILDQNAKMAHAVGEYERMYSESAMRLFPYVVYQASVGSKNPRSEHQKYDGMIFAKTDPWLKTHTPPWEFGCNCRLRQISAKQAGREPEKIQVPTPEEKVRVESKSGYSFNPADALETFEMGSVKTPRARVRLHDSMLGFCKKEECYASLRGAPPPLESQKLLQESYREPENIKEIKETLRKVENRKTEPLEEFSISVGKVLPEHAERLGLTDFNEDIIFKHQKGNKRVGPSHWEKNHDNTLNTEEIIKLFRTTLWNPYAEISEDVYGNSRRICVFVKDRDTGDLTNIWVVKDNDGKLVLEVVDSWHTNRNYIDNLGSRHRKKN